jgi:hypothetical protein
MKEKTLVAVILMVSVTLCLILLSMVGVMCVGLFDPLVDNTEIFKLISPAFQTIVGGFIGLLAGIQVNQKPAEEREIN